MSELRDRAMALAALVEAFGVKDFTAVRTRAYEDALKDIPIPLLNAAVRKAITERTFFPKVSEVRADAEACRQQLISAHPFAACDSCNGTGWTPVLVADVNRYTRCMCWKAHQEKLAGLGVGSQPLALPPAESRTDWDAA